MQCKRLILNIPKPFIYEFDEVNSIEDAFAKNESIWLREVFGNRQMKVQISAEEEFRGHCSNLQVWYENDYDTRLLHSNLSFPLLRQLTRVGDPKAKKVFKSEVAIRFEEGNETVRTFLLNEGYLRFLTPLELQTLMDETYHLLSASLKRRINTLLRQNQLIYAKTLSKEKIVRAIVEGKYDDMDAFYYVKFLRKFRYDQLKTLKGSVFFKPPDIRKFDRIYEEKKKYFEEFISKFRTLENFF
jgi:hypothetical protein